VEAPFEFICVVPNRPDQVKLVGGAAPAAADPQAC